MALTRAQFARAAAMEASQQRTAALQRMTCAELRRILAGDPREAAVWVRSAAEQGIPAAQLRWGRMLLEGDGVPRDRGAAFAWFERAATQGDADGCNMVGRCFENGWGVAQDPARAAGSYRRSAEAGNDWGEYNLANLLFDGRGIAQDRPRALEGYLRAACRGHGRAMNLAARCYEEGWGCAPSLAQAKYWYRRSAETGYFRAQFNYAMILLQQHDPSQAAEWFSRALDSGDDAIRRAIAAALAAARHPDLVAVRHRAAVNPR